MLCPLRPLHSPFPFAPVPSAAAPHPNPAAMQAANLEGVGYLVFFFFAGAMARSAASTRGTALAAHWYFE